MIIDFSRSGGFTGIAGPSAHIDTLKLPPDQARKVAELIHRARFWDQPGTTSRRTPGADRFQYTIRASGEGRTHVVGVADGEIPAELEPLVEYLTEFARKEVGGKGS